MTAAQLVRDACRRIRWPFRCSESQLYDWLCRAWREFLDH